VAIKHYLQDIELKLTCEGQHCRGLGESYLGIGKAQAKLERYQEALNYFKKSLEIRTLYVGAKNPVTAEIHENIALVLCEMGQFDTALVHAMLVYAVRESFQGLNHPATAAAAIVVGYVYCKLGFCNEALEYHSKALKIMQEGLDETYSAPAKVHWQVGDKGYEKQGSMYSLECYANTNASVTDYPLRSTLNIAFADLYIHLGEYEKAVESSIVALDSNLKTFGEFHQYTANSFRMLGRAYFKMKNYAEALKNLQKALEIRLKTQGEINNLIVAESYADLGEYYSEIRDYKQATELFFKAYSIAAATVGDGHKKTLKYLVSLADTCKNKGDQKEADKFYNKAKELDQLQHSSE
jgi:tetratricopeptide (TPR) repeat protein